MASPTSFAHVVFRTHRFEEMLDWYVRVFEADIVHRDEMLAFLTYDDEHHRFAIVNLGPADDPGHAERAGAGVEHLAWGYRSLGDLIDTYRRLAAEGIEPYWPIRHGPTLSMYYRDPDGNQLELQVDSYETPDEMTDFMRSSAFAENPIGIEFDPSDLAAAYERGEPEAELLRRPDAPAPT